MSGTRAQQAFQHFTHALENLERNLALPADNEAYRNSSLLSFILAYEQCWKLLKRTLLEREGIEANGPRSAFIEAFQQGWLGEDDQIWLNMIQDSNLVTHTYDEEQAMAIYQHLAAYSFSMRTLYTRLK